MDAAESVKGKATAAGTASAAAKSGSSTTTKPVTAPGAPGTAKNGAGAGTAKSGPAPAKSGAAPGTAKSGAAPGSTKAASPSATRSGSATAKGTPGGGPKPSPSGPNYRPPTGAARSSARRPPPPPRRKKPRITKRTVGAIVAMALVASLVVFFALAVNGSSGNTPGVNAALAGSTPEGLAVPSGSSLAAVDSGRYPQTIDSIKCQATEQVVYHIHAHLAIFVNGQARQVPYGIGIAGPLQYNTTNGTFVNGGSCFYWLHTHAADGIIHIESPTQTTYNLGQFFDEWGQPLDSGRVGPAVGKVQVFVDGKAYTGDPRLIPFATHTQIQLDVGSKPPGPTTITFPQGL